MIQLPNNWRDFIEKIKSHLTVLSVSGDLTNLKKDLLIAVSASSLACLVFVIFNTTSPLKIISPMISSLSILRPLFQQESIHEVFTFVPGSVSRRFDLIDLKNVNTLAYFDIPVLGDGTYYRDTDSYAVLKDERATDLFYRAHNAGVNVLLTLTQADTQSIRQLVTDGIAQQMFLDETEREIRENNVNGVVIDFEFLGNDGENYKAAFVQFVETFSKNLHKRLPNATVAVALPNDATKKSFYDVQGLANASDKVFLMAYTFPIAEQENGKLKAPRYGYNEKEYWQTVASAMNTFLPFVSAEKIVTEVAYYMNGDYFPFTYSEAEARQNDAMPSQNTLKTPLSQATINRLVIGVPAQARESARKNLPYVARALENEGILTQNVLAYALATIEHETAGTFEPIAEYKGRKSARRLGYEGGQQFAGRGFIQITHLRNYKRMGQRIGMGDALVKNPDLAMQPEVSAKILAAFFKQNNVARQAMAGDFISARMPINPDQQAWSIAYLAYKYLYQLG